MDERDARQWMEYVRPRLIHVVRVESCSFSSAVIVLLHQHRVHQSRRACV